MKPSKYNYIVPNEGKYIFFNGITEAFFEVSEDKLETYEEIISNPTEYLNSFNSFLKTMIEKGFVINEDIDEDKQLENKFLAILEEDLYHIMILPTYQCNLRCWYCTQDHNNLWMSEELANHIKNLIKKRIFNQTIKRIRLSWFGGEPTLCYNHIVDITSFTKNLAQECNKTFSCDMTTNGTLLTKDRIQQ